MKQSARICFIFMIVMHKVVCFGEILWDNFISGKRPGGAPLNVALHLNKQGVGSELISSVGRDHNGKELTEYILAQGLSLHYLQQHDDLATGVVDVVLDEDKQATYTIAEPVAWDEIRYHEDLNKLVEASDALVFGSLACRSHISRSTLLRLLETSKLAIFDMNLRPPHYEHRVLDELIQRCDVLKLNEHELEFVQTNYNLESAANFEDQLRQLSHRTQTFTICITLGEKGVIALHNGHFYRHPGFKATVADTVGAGDAFLAAFIGGFLQKEPMAEILTMACATGALVASRHGANPPYTSQEIAQIRDVNLTNE